MIFEDITLSWQGREYTVAADNVMRMLAKVEDVVTLAEITLAQERGGVPAVKVAMAYGIALRHAGCRVRDDEVYSAMFADGDAALRLTTAVTSLQCMMIPPAHLRGKGDATEGDAPGKEQPASNS